MRKAGSEESATGAQLELTHGRTAADHSALPSSPGGLADLFHDEQDG